MQDAAQRGCRQTNIDDDGRDGKAARAASSRVKADYS
jgi:hypothetical protein